MSRKISFLLIAVLVLASFASAFAAEIVAPADLKDTKYEKAVLSLMEKGIISGYSDGTYRPDSTISRAEACIMVVKAMAPAEKSLQEAAQNSFIDLAGYDWAAKYINYAAAKGIVSGYEDGTYRPSAQVSYGEMATMLVRALGVNAEELTGAWPDNYIAKATELGIFTNVSYHKAAPALRGNAAMMTSAVAGDIEKNNKEEDPGIKDDDSQVKPEKDPDKDTANPLAGFSGTAYGVLLDVAQALNDKGDKVDEYEFLFGKNILNIKTNGRVTSDIKIVIDAHLNAGEIYGLRMNNGVVTKFGTSDDGFLALNSPAGYDDLGITAWAQVKGVKNRVIETNSLYGGRDFFTVLENASIYVAKKEKGVIPGYEKGSISDIDANDYVRLYSVTGDAEKVAEIVLVRE